MLSYVFLSAPLEQYNYDIPKMPFNFSYISLQSQKDFNSTAPTITEAGRESAGEILKPHCPQGENRNPHGRPHSRIPLLDKTDLRKDPAMTLDFFAKYLSV